METLIKPPSFFDKVDSNIAIEYLYVPSAKERYDEKYYIFVRNYHDGQRLPGYFRFIFQDKYVESIPSPDSTLKAFKVDDKGIIRNKSLALRLRRHFNVDEDQPLVLVNSIGTRYYQLLM